MSVNKSLTIIDTEVRKGDQVNSSNMNDYYCYIPLYFWTVNMAEVTWYLSCTGYICKG